MKFLPFIIFAGVSTVISATGSTVMKTYFGTKKDSETEIATTFGSRMSVDDFLKDDLKEAKWLSSGSYNVETYTKYKDEDMLDNQIITYSKEDNLFTFNGVGKGYVKFISKIDSTISFTKFVNSSFRTDCTVDIIEKVAPGLGGDGAYTKEEISEISTIILDNIKTYDFSDINYFTGLKSIVVNHSNKNLLNVSNLGLNDNVCFYVGSLYEEYMSRADLAWAAYKKQIFIDKPASDETNLIIYKNNGTLSKDDDIRKDVQSFLVKKDQTTDLLSGESIFRHGYDFVKYTLYDNSEISVDSNTIISQNLKVIANFNAKQFDVNYHIPEKTGDTVITKKFTYDKKETLLDADDVPSLTNRVFVGWSTLQNGIIVEYKGGEEITNINNGLDTDLYAVFRWNCYGLNFTNDNGKNLSITNVSSDFEESHELLEYFADETRGILMGWNCTNPEDTTPEYNTTKIPFIEIFSISFNDETPILTMHAVYAKGVKCTVNFYCNDVLLDYHILDLTRETPFDIPKADLLCADPKFEEVLGYKLVGWKDGEKKDGKVYLYEDPSSGIHFDGLNFTTTTYRFDACFEANTINFEYWDFYEGKYVPTSIKFNENKDLAFPNTYNTRTGYIHYGFEYDFNLFGEISRRKTGPINSTESGNNFVINKSDITSLYTMIVSDEDVDNQHFESSVGMITLKETNSGYVKNTITFDLDGGRWVYGDTTKTLEYNEIFPNLSTSPTKNSSTFQGWKCVTDPSISLNSLFDKKYTLNKDLKFLATYTGCVVGDTNVELSNGQRKNIRDVVLGDYVKTYDLFTGQVVYSPVLYVEISDFKQRDAIYLDFDDGTSIGFVTGHVFFDATLMKYVTILENNYNDFIGHKFAKVNENNEIETHILKGARCVEEITDMCEIVTGDGIISFNANGYLSSSNYTEGLVNLFDVNENFVFDEESIKEDISNYGVYELSDLEEFGISKELFEAYNAKYLKVPVEKGTLDFDWIIFLFEEYINEN